MDISAACFNCIRWSQILNLLFVFYSKLQMQPVNLAEQKVGSN